MVLVIYAHPYIILTYIRNWILWARLIKYNWVYLIPSHNSLHGRSVLKITSHRLNHCRPKRILNPLMIHGKIFTAEWSAEKITDPEGNDFLFAICSPWSWYTHILAAMLWLLRSPPNGLQSHSLHFENHFYHPCELGHTSKSILRAKRGLCCIAEPGLSHVHCVDSGFINYVLKAKAQPHVSALKWMQFSII